MIRNGRKVISNHMSIPVNRSFINLNLINSNYSSNQKDQKCFKNPHTLNYTKNSFNSFYNCFKKLSHNKPLIEEYRVIILFTLVTG